MSRAERETAHNAAGEELELAKAFVNAVASRAGLTGVSFLSSIFDGAAAGRIPAGWDQEGISWLPYCCTAEPHIVFLDCGDNCDDPIPTFADNANAATGVECLQTAKPFLIEIDEFQNPCITRNMREYAQFNLGAYTSLVFAFIAHQQMRENATDVTGTGGSLGILEALGILRANRLHPGAIWIPSIAADAFAEAGAYTLTGGRAIDNYGRRVFIGPGIPNVAPDGTPAPPGTAWVYISSPGVDYAVTETETAEYVSVRGNNTCPHVERKGIVRVDGCDVFAVLVSLDNCGATIPPVGPALRLQKLANLVPTGVLGAPVPGDIIYFTFVGREHRQR